MLLCWVRWDFIRSEVMFQVSKGFPIYLALVVGNMDRLGHLSQGKNGTLRLDFANFGVFEGSFHRPFWDDHLRLGCGLRHLRPSLPNQLCQHGIKMKVLAWRWVINPPSRPTCHVTSGRPSSGRLLCQMTSHWTTSHLTSNRRCPTHHLTSIPTHHLTSPPLPPLGLMPVPVIPVIVLSVSSGPSLDFSWRLHRHRRWNSNPEHRPQEVSGQVTCLWFASMPQIHRAILLHNPTKVLCQLMICPHRHTQCRLVAVSRRSILRVGSWIREQNHQFTGRRWRIQSSCNVFFAFEFWMNPHKAVSSALPWTSLEHKMPYF